MHSIIDQAAAAAATVTSAAVVSRAVGDLEFTVSAASATGRSGVAGPVLSTHASPFLCQCVSTEAAGTAGDVVFTV